MNNQSLNQKQIDMQLLELIQQQDDLNSVLGLMLCSAECLSNRFGREKKETFFDYYNLNNAGNKKSEKNLKDQLKIQTKIFRNNYLYMLNKKGSYPFPNNFKKNDIISLINYWKLNAKNEDQLYFDNILRILNGDFNLTYPQKTISNEGLPPEGILNYFPSAMSYVDGKRDEIAYDYLNNGYYSNELKFGENIKNKDYFPYRNCNNNSQNNKMQIEKDLINFLDYTFNKAENYYYLLKGKDKNYDCIFGNKKEYDYNNKVNLERDLIDCLNKLKPIYEKYLMNFDSISPEINKYQFKLVIWFNETKNYIFNDLKNLLNFNNK